MYVKIKKLMIKNIKREGEKKKEWIMSRKDLWRKDWRRINWRAWMGIWEEEEEELVKNGLKENLGRKIISGEREKKKKGRKKNV